MSIQPISPWRVCLVTAGSFWSITLEAMQRSTQYLSCLTLQLASGDSDGSFSTLSYSCCNCPTHMAASGTKALNSRHTKLAMQTQGLHGSREPQWLQPEVMACSTVVLLQLQASRVGNSKSRLQQHVQASVAGMQAAVGT